MTVDLTNWQPQGIDMFCAVSQTALNIMLATYFMENPVSVNAAFDPGPNDTLIPPANPQQPQISFTGSVAAQNPLTNGPLQFIDLSTGTPGANTLVFELNFGAGAKFENQGKTFQLSSSATTLWTTKFTVGISAIPANLSTAVLNQLKLLNGNYGSIFSMQQVLADLSVATLTATPAPSGVDSASWTTLGQVIQAWFAANLAAGQIPLGYAATKTGTGPTTPPVMTPTSMVPAVVPNPATPGNSALVYCMMTQNRAQQPNPAVLFDGVTIFDTSETASGVIAVSSGLLTEQIISAVQSSTLPQAAAAFPTPGETEQDLDPYITASASLNSSSGTMTQLNPQDNNGGVMNFAYTNSDSISGKFMSGSYNMGTSVNSTFNVSLSPQSGQSTLTISGTWTFSATYYYDPTFSSSVDDNTGSLPLAWTNTWKIGNNNSSSGALTFTQQGALPNWQSGTADNTWASALQQDGMWNYETLLSAIPGAFYNLITNALEQIQLTLNSVQQGFVLPGSSTFGFSNVRLNSQYMLLTDLTFQNQ